MLTDRQKLAIEMLADDERINTIAHVCGVHRTTIWRWTQKKEFRRELRRCTREQRRELDRTMKTIRQRQRRWEKRQSEKIELLGERLQAEAAKTGKNSKPSPAFYKLSRELDRALEELWSEAGK